MKLRNFIILICVLYLTACSKDDILPVEVLKPTNIFTLNEYSISNGEEVGFELKENGTYILKLVNYQTNQVLSKEKITGKIGVNLINVYTNTLPVNQFYLILETDRGNELSKVKLNKK